ncbi:MAG TPA: BamA/TamA family outer membrane protein [Kofleriaceae bacterium]
MKLLLGGLTITALAQLAHADEPTGSFAIGAGYNTDDGFGASASVAQTDLFHLGKLLSLDASIDERAQLFEARYSDPEFLGSDVQLDVTAFDDAHHFDEFWHREGGVQLSLSKIVAPHVKMYGSYRISSVHDDADYADSALEATYTVGALRGGIEYNTLDAPYGATRGSRLGGYVELATPALGSSDALQMIHTRTYGETHVQLGRGFRFNGYGSFETADSYGPDALFAGERIQFDGSSQLRGYAPLAFGPRDDTGHTLGANLAAFGRAELEAPLFGLRNLSAVGFVDGGFMADSHSTGEVAATTGFGVMWRSPIGPIGGYFAWPSLHDSPVFVFGVGSTFGAK